MRSPIVSVRIIKIIIILSLLLFLFLYLSMYFGTQSCISKFVTATCMLYYGMHLSVALSDLGLALGNVALRGHWLVPRGLPVSGALNREAIFGLKGHRVPWCGFLPQVP